VCVCRRWGGVRGVYVDTLTRGYISAYEYVDTWTRAHRVIVSLWHHTSCHFDILTNENLYVTMFLTMRKKKKPHCPTCPLTESTLRSLIFRL